MSLLPSIFQATLTGESWTDQLHSPSELPAPAPQATGNPSKQTAPQKGERATWNPGLARSCKWSSVGSQGFFSNPTASSILPTKFPVIGVNGIAYTGRSAARSYGIRRSEVPDHRDHRSMKTLQGTMRSVDTVSDKATAAVASYADVEKRVRLFLRDSIV